ncbi:14885_t:CDS:1 [Dentiscutata erythropus]|uniref:14885_t:CDS:1 n=1 Tax=Dentiscutata erythropus TaxID=1348616 RepID=A0A9N9HDI0_9GLOM|nr:14885_t:CDS:1 [Dentiscutata erythropus]
MPKSHEIIYKTQSPNVRFEHADGYNTFQRGELGLSKSCLEGKLVFDRRIKVNSIEFSLKGIEETNYVPVGGRIKSRFSGFYKLTEKSKIISLEGTDPMEHYDFKFPLNSNLSSSFLIGDKEKNVNGRIYYIFSVTVSTPGTFFNQKTLCEIYCPLNQVLPYFSTPYKDVIGKHTISNEPLFEYSFKVPEYFGLGTTIYVPIQVTFLESKVKIVRIDISLKEVTKYTFESDEEPVKTRKQCCTFFEEPAKISNNRLEQNLTLKVPDDLNSSYSGTFVEIKYKICIKFTLVGGGINIGSGDFYKEQTVIVANFNKLNNSDQGNNNTVLDEGPPQEEKSIQNEESVSSVQGTPQEPQNTRDAQ